MHNVSPCVAYVLHNIAEVCDKCKNGNRYDHDHDQGDVVALAWWLSDVHTAQTCM